MDNGQRKLCRNAELSGDGDDDRKYRKRTSENQTGELKGEKVEEVETLKGRLLFNFSPHSTLILFPGVSLIERRSNWNVAAYHLRSRMPLVRSYVAIAPEVMEGNP